MYMNQSLRTHACHFITEDAALVAYHFDSRGRAAFHNNSVFSHGPVSLQYVHLSVSVVHNDSTTMMRKGRSRLWIAVPMHRLTSSLILDARDLMDVR